MGQMKEQLLARVLDAKDDALWDRLVDASPQGGIFQTSAFLRMLAETDPGLEIVRLGLTGCTGELTGGQALVYRRSAGIPMPTYSQYFSALDTPMLAAALNAPGHKTMVDAQAALNSLAEGAVRAAGFAEFRTHPSLKDMRPYLFMGWKVEPVYHSSISLVNMEQTWKNILERKRRYAQSALQKFKAGVESSTAIMDLFMDLYWREMERHHLADGKKWEAAFRRRAAWMEERDLCRMITLRDEAGNLAAGMFCILNPGKRSVHTYRQAVHPDYMKNGGVIPALYWATALEVCREFEKLELGVTNSPGLMQFKDEMGGAISIGYNVQAPDGQKKFVWLNRLRKWKNALRR